MKRLFLLILILCGCGGAIENIRVLPQEPNKLETNNQDKIIRAWKQLENEAVISILESAELKYWSVINSIILIERTHLDTLLYSKVDKLFFRVSVMKNGTLFLDLEEMELSNLHKERLIKLYNKVIYDQR